MAFFWNNSAGKQVMDSIIQWAIDSVANALDTITIDFISDFRPNIAYFNEQFPNAASYYPTFMTIGVILTFVIFLFTGLFLMFGIITGYEEKPLTMVGRTCMAFFMVAYSGHIMNFIYDLGNEIFDLLAGTERLKDWAEIELFSLTNFLVGAKEFNALLKLLLMIIIMWHMMKLFLEIVERYLVMVLYWYMGPIANASFASKMTSRVFSTFYMGVFIQVLICALNVWFMRLTIDICVLDMADNASATEIITRGLLIIAWLTVAQRIDQYLKAMGFGAVQTGGSLGRAIAGTIMTATTIAKTGISVASGVKAATGVPVFKDAAGKVHATKENMETANAAYAVSGVMSRPSDMVPNQDAYMSTDNKGKAVATMVGDVGKEVALNSNIPGIHSSSVMKDTIVAGAMQGEPFTLEYRTTDGSVVSGHTSRLPEENGVQGIKSIGKSGEAVYTYFDKGSGLPTGTGLEMGKTSTLQDANLSTAIPDSEGKVDISTGAWNQTVMQSMGFNEVSMDSRMTLHEKGKIEVQDSEGHTLGTVITSDNKQFEAAKALGNYYEDPSNGNRVVGIPESELKGLSLEAENVASYPNVSSIIGEEAIVYGQQTLETDGIQSYVTTLEDGSVMKHQFVTASNLDYERLNTYEKVTLPNQGIVYHRSQPVRPRVDNQKVENSNSGRHNVAPSNLGSTGMGKLNVTSSNVKKPSVERVNISTPKMTESKEIHHKKKK